MATPFKKSPQETDDLPLDEIGLKDLAPTLKALAKEGGELKHARWIRSSKENAAFVVHCIEREIRRQKELAREIQRQQELAEKNPFQKSSNELLAALHRANGEEGWGITEEVFERLAATVPAWPKGKNAYLSFRIRFGEGDEGVALTFERHTGRIKSVFTEKGYWRWEHLHSGKALFEGEPVERLRLLAGNDTHKACVEWVIIELGTYRKRENVTAVRGNESLADELLVAAWLYPEMVRAIDYDKNPGLFAAGYEVNIPERGIGVWQDVVIVDFRRGNPRVDVHAFGSGHNGSDYSVPVLRKLPVALAA